MPEKICPTCGKSFHVKPSHMDRRKTCSRECAKRQAEKTCLYCGKHFIVQLHRKDTAKFCSRSCATKHNWKIGKLKPHIPTKEELKKKSDTAKRIGLTPPDQTGKTWTLSEETKKKQSEYAKRIGRKPPSRKGATLSEETKAKLRKGRMKQKFPLKDTSIEIALQEELTRRGIKYETHTPILGLYQPDIVFPTKKIAVFADGDYWHSKEFDNGKRWERDRRQDKILAENGWKICRFWEHEINESPSDCIDRVIESI